MNRRHPFSALLHAALAFTLMAGCGSDPLDAGDDPAGAGQSLGEKNGGSAGSTSGGAAGASGGDASGCAVPAIAFYVCPDGTAVGLVAYRDEKGQCATRKAACPTTGTGADAGSTPPAPPAAGSGESCGGGKTLAAPAACKAGLTCRKAPGRCTTPPDDTGVCEDTPTACTKEYAPVCGCDGKTYGNDCTRRAANVGLDYKGECKTTPGKEPGKVGATCGGIAGLPCAAGLFCELAPGSCRIADAAGTCQAKPEACTLQYAPVCGCDGKTYGNDCARRGAGVSKDRDGECAAATTTRLKEGVWGATGANLTVKDSSAGASFELDCAHGTIDGPLTLASDGTFKWTGTYVKEGGVTTQKIAPAPLPPPPPKPVFTGRVKGDVLALTIDDTVKLELRLGVTGTLTKCK